MIDHIYPIAYLGGSGGAFLTSWLNNAAYGSPIIINPNVGHAHRSSRYGGFGDFEDPNLAVELLRNKFTNEQNKWFVSSHLVDNTFILNNFAKSTKITYEQDDVLEIAINYSCKNSPHTSKVSNDFLYSRLDETKNIHSSMAIPLPETDHSTNVPWKLLVHDDPFKLRDHLANFYEIKPTRFSMSAIDRWRSLTLRNINDTRNKFGDAG